MRNEINCFVLFETFCWWIRCEEGTLTKRLETTAASRQVWNRFIPKHEKFGRFLVMCRNIYE